MGKLYHTLAQEAYGEYTVSRSRFICRAKPVSREEDALAYIEQIRKTNWDASHHVWAYLLCEDKERYSDDGEPRGSAGMQLLQVIRKEGLSQVIVVITRYFGGVKLGVGGLARAYTESAKIALDAGIPIQKRPFRSLDIRLAYPLVDRFRHNLDRLGYPVGKIEYQDQVVLTVLVPDGEESNLQALCAEITAGNVHIQTGSEVYLDYRNGEPYHSA